MLKWAPHRHAHITTSQTVRSGLGSEDVDPRGWVRQFGKILFSPKVQDCEGHARFQAGELTMVAGEHCRAVSAVDDWGAEWNISVGNADRSRVCGPPRCAFLSQFVKPAIKTRLAGLDPDRRLLSENETAKKTDSRPRPALVTTPRGRPMPHFLESPVGSDFTDLPASTCAHSSVLTVHSSLHEQLSPLCCFSQPRTVLSFL